MIAHFSMSARDPQATATLLARLMGGRVIPFAPVPGACAVVVLDGQGTMVEVLPEATVIEPGIGQAGPKAEFYPAPWAAQFTQARRAAEYAPFHVAIATQCSTEDVLAVGQEAGLRTLVCNRGGQFDVVEMWMDDRFMIEWLVPVEQARYRALFTPEAMRAMMEQIRGMTAPAAADAAARRPEPALAN